MHALLSELVPWALTALLTLNVWVVRTLWRLDRSVTVMRVQLVGENGDNGINGETKKHRRKLHRLTDAVGNLLLRMHLQDGQGYQAALGDDE